MVFDPATDHRTEKIYTEEFTADYKKFWNCRTWNTWLQAERIFGERLDERQPLWSQRKTEMITQTGETQGKGKRGSSLRG